MNRQFRTMADTSRFRGWRSVASLLGAVSAALAFAPSCSITIPTDALPSGVELAPAGVMEGSIAYAGPHPCSQNGHIVGSAIIFAFSVQDQPPPNGIATTPVNFVAVPGDALFPNEPRTSGSEMVCPLATGNTEQVNSSASWTLAPMSQGQFVIQSFYDYTGNFLPSFKFSDLPELGDIGGGYVTLNDAGEAVFLSVAIGTPDPSDPSGTGYAMPSEGFVASGIPINIRLPITTTRPYFYPQGEIFFEDGGAQLLDDSTIFPPSAQTPASTESDPYYVPILTMSQDIQTARPPNPQDLLDLLTQTPIFESTLPHLRLNYGLPDDELDAGTNPAEPFKFQVAPYSPLATSTANLVLAPTSNWVPGFREQLVSFSPTIAMMKLVDDSPADGGHDNDPESVTTQGNPIVLMQAITLGDDGNGNDSLTLTANPALSGAAAIPTRYMDHVTGAILPLAICFDPNDLTNATLVTPYGPSNAPADDAGAGEIIPADCFGDNPTCDLIEDLAAQGIHVAHVVAGCLPTGRFAISADYEATGQAWTTPNESGSCAAEEGTTEYGARTCSVQPRPILPSQGNRAVFQVVAAPGDCGPSGAVAAVPAACLPPAQ